MGSLRRRLLPLRFLIVLAALTEVVTAATPPEGLDRKKLQRVVAAYLVKFANHVRWPAEAFPGNEPVTIAILGRDPFGPVLDELIAGKTAAGRPLRAVRVERPEELGRCDIVFMDQPTESTVAAAARAVAGRPVLLIAFEAEGGGSAAAVDLVLTKDETVRYKLSVNALKRAGLVPSPGLLEHALKGAQRDDAPASAPP